jgi:hypothetical protein
MIGHNWFDCGIGVYGNNLIIIIMKTIVTLLTFLASIFWAQAQGEIYFRTTVPPTRISTNSMPGGLATGVTVPGALYYYALFYSTTATTVGGTSGPIVGVASGGGSYAFDDPNWTYVALGTNFSFGRLLSTVQNTDGSTTVTGVPAGSAANFVVVGWSASMGANLPAVKNYYDQVYYDQNDWIGQSAVSGLITWAMEPTRCRQIFLGLSARRFGVSPWAKLRSFYPNQARWF